jgi:hypothetical protein
MKLEEFVKRYTQAIISLIVSLVVLFFVLNWLHQHGGPASGIAGKVGSLASGQSYSFGG